MTEAWAAAAAAFLIGLIVGLAYFGSLETSVRSLRARGPQGRPAFALATVERLAVVIAAFVLAALAGAPAAALLAAAAGFLSPRIVSTVVGRGGRRAQEGE